MADSETTVTLSPASEFLSACPKFRILVLGTPESTKQLLFSEVFGVGLEKVSLRMGSPPVMWPVVVCASLMDTHTCRD